jgi:hypothetical protein
MKNLPCNHCREGDLFGIHILYFGKINDITIKSFCLRVSMRRIGGWYGGYVLPSGGTGARLENLIRDDAQAAGL